jgi:hypothetical protein
VIPAGLFVCFDLYIKYSELSETKMPSLEIYIWLVLCGLAGFLEIWGLDKFFGDVARQMTTSVSSTVF